MEGRLRVDPGDRSSRSILAIEQEEDARRLDAGGGEALTERRGTTEMMMMRCSLDGLRPELPLPAGAAAAAAAAAMEWHVESCHERVHAPWPS